MRRPDWQGSRAVLATWFVGVCLASVVAAQTGAPTTPKCKTGPQSAGCKRDDKAGTSAQEGGGSSAPPSAANFAFPTEDSKHGADAEGTEAPRPAPQSSHSLPDMPTSGVPDPPSASEQPLHLPGDASSSSSSSSSSSDAPSGADAASSSGRTEDDDVAPTIPDPKAPVKATPLKDLGSKADLSGARAKLEQTRVADDMKVGTFYAKSGNTQGAYLRFKDALEHAPEDPDVRFDLAETAARLNKRDEAVLNYREYLRLDPGGDHDKASRKALEKLSVDPK